MLWVCLQLLILFEDVSVLGVLRMCLMLSTVFDVVNLFGGVDIIQ